LWEVGFGNGVRKIHSEFNEVPNVLSYFPQLPLLKFTQTEA
jgi:hypothetical protein